MSTTRNTTAAPAALASVQPEQPCMAIFTAVSAMTLMFEKSYKHLTAKEMEWLADGAAEKVNTDIRALSSFVEKTARMALSDETGIFQTLEPEGTSDMLFSLHNQLDAIAGMAEVSEQANWLVREAVKGGAA